jgi:hypothetical protein
VDKDEEAQWLPVIAKSLAVLALHRAELGNSSMGERAEFLLGLGVPRADAAGMLGTSADSLRVLLAQKKKGGKRGKSKKG